MEQLLGSADEDSVWRPHLSQDASQEELQSPQQAPAPSGPVPAVPTTQAKTAAPAARLRFAEESSSCTVATEAEADEAAAGLPEVQSHQVCNGSTYALLSSTILSDGPSGSACLVLGQFAGRIMHNWSRNNQSSKYDPT